MTHASEDTLGFVPDWWDAVIAECVERQSALINLWGDPHRDLLDDIPPDRLARDRIPLTPAMIRAISASNISWTIVPAPCRGLAQAIVGTPDVERLWEVLTPMLRLDAPDRARAWKEHVTRLNERAAALERHHFSALRFRGGGTDLTVGVLPQTRWMSATMQTSWGTSMVVNMPTEEIFTMPDHRRTEGVARVTRPVNLTGGGRVEGLTIRFERGRQSISMPAGEPTWYARRWRRTRARLVSARWRWLMARPRSARADWCLATLCSTRTRPATSRGGTYAFTVPDLPEDPEAQDALGFNCSEVHQDAMIGGPGIGVFGVDREGREIPIIAADEWVLGSSPAPGPGSS